MANSLSPFLKQANIGELDTQRVAAACVTWQLNALVFRNLFATQINSRVYEARLRQHSFRGSLISFSDLEMVDGYIAGSKCLTESDSKHLSSFVHKLY